MRSESRRSGKQSEPHPQQSSRYLPCTVHLQPLLRRSSNRGQAANLACFTIGLEVIFPAILTRMKESHFSRRCRIQPRDVVAFEDVTGAAGQCEIGFVIHSLTGRWNVMLDLKREVEDRFGRATVLAAVS